MFRKGKGKGTVWNTTCSINYRWYMGFFCYPKQAFQKNCFHLESSIVESPNACCYSSGPMSPDVQQTPVSFFSKKCLDEPINIEESGDE
jgi:hypothetical protein